MTRVFVTDALYKHSLAMIQTLSKYYSVDCGDSRPFALSFFSRKTKRRCLYPDPRSHPGEFAKGMVKLASDMRYDAVLPVSYDACVSIAKFAPRFDKVMLPSVDSMMIASNKAQTTSFARELNISTPETIRVTSAEDLMHAAKELGFPFFLKNIFGSGQNKLIRSERELKGIGERLIASWGGNLIAQEPVKGDGCGFFALFNRGSLKAYFMHRRIRESRPDGGPSTCAESIYDSRLKEHGIRVLQALDWHGVAMVEFRRTTDDEYKILEINPKFWGSLELAIASGVNFPRLVVECITTGDCETATNYRTNLRFQWPIPDDFARLAWTPFALWTVLDDLLSPTVKKNLTIHDPGPAIVQCLQLAYLYGRAMRNSGRTA